METTRQQKISKLLMKDLGDMFLREIPEMISERVMITVTKVRVSRDLSLARIYISIFAAPDKEAVLEKIRKHAKPIRLELGKRIRHQLRVVPELIFEHDDSLDYIDHIDELLNE